MRLPEARFHELSRPLGDGVSITAAGHRPGTNNPRLEPPAYGTIGNPCGPLFSLALSLRASR